MSQEDDFPDEPLPEDPPPIEGEGGVIFERSHSSEESGDITSLDDQPAVQPLAAPIASVGYGHTDPASLASVQSTELAHPDLHVQEQPAMAEAAVVSEPVAAIETPPPTESTESAKLDLSNWDPHLAHLAQVGLTSSDHWEEQIKPRITQLQDEITEVHGQLDDLVKAKPFHKLS